MHNCMPLWLVKLLQELTSFAKVFSAPNYVDQAGNKGAFVSGYDNDQRISYSPLVDTRGFEWRERVQAI